MSYVDQNERKYQANTNIFAQYFLIFHFSLTDTNLTQDNCEMGKLVLTPMPHPTTSQSSMSQLITSEASGRSLGQFSSKDHVLSLI